MSQFVPPFIKVLEEKDPSLYALVTELMGKALAPGALDAKTKVLITLALDALKGAEEGVAVLSRKPGNWELPRRKLPKLCGWPILYPECLLWPLAQRPGNNQVKTWILWRN